MSEPPYVPVLNTARLTDFIAESNRIEGIERSVWLVELEAHAWLLSEPKLSVAHVSRFVEVVAGMKHRLRDQAGLNVRVGGHTPPAGGRQVGRLLHEILGRVNGRGDPFECHRAYENLHPFTDGNGRSGRAIWLWQMQRQHGGAPLGFLHHWYYQSLAAGDREVVS